MFDLFVDLIFHIFLQFLCIYHSFLMSLALFQKGFTLCCIVTLFNNCPRLGRVEYSHTYLTHPNSLFAVLSQEAVLQWLSFIFVFHFIVMNQIVGFPFRTVSYDIILGPFTEYWTVWVLFIIEGLKVTCICLHILVLWSFVDRWLIDKSTTSS